MRAIAMSLGIFLVVGCGAKQPKEGWSYQPAHGAYQAGLYYDFDDSQGTGFIGICAGEPQFMMAGGAWEGGEFRLTVDGRSWSLPTRQGEHGHYLPAEDYLPAQAIANAKQRIVFEVGKWRRELRPSPALTSFVHDCS
ncbi:MAG TPA: hypothetical protein VH331_02320 [Allosphingosinicella sp.]|jgi:hypothetical protein|nr:hypothetical protein [Allosphingosinicella sp.]